jgi:hypothetical protein
MAKPTSALRMAILALIAAVPGPAKPADGVDPPAVLVACRAAGDLIAAQIEGNRPRSKVIVYDFGTDFLTSMIKPGQEISWRPIEDGAGDAVPPDGLLEEFLGAPHRNAVEQCPSIRALLKAQGIRFGKRASAAAVSSQAARGVRARPLIFTVELPAVSGDGRDAVLSAAHSFGNLDGAGELLHLRRQDDGSWRVTGGVRLWVS